MLFNYVLFLKNKKEHNCYVRNTCFYRAGPKSTNNDIFSLIMYIKKIINKNHFDVINLKRHKIFKNNKI